MKRESKFLKIPKSTSVLVKYGLETQIYRLANLWAFYFPAISIGVCAKFVPNCAHPDHLLLWFLHHLSDV